MSEIAAPVSFSADAQLIIDSVARDPLFNYTQWGRDDLEAVRVEARNYYKVAQAGRCAYCRAPVSLATASNCHVEHIAPKSKYPAYLFVPKNLCVICADCNAIKRDQEISDSVPQTIRGAGRVQYPRSSGAFLIVHPHFDVYRDHIHVVGRYYLGKSAKGNFTISACRLNRHLEQFGWEMTVFNEPQIEALMNMFLNTTDFSIRAAVLTQLKDHLFLC